jgi:biotin carboxyl carrier protein
VKYFSTIGDRVYEVEIGAHGRITVDGQEMVADMRLVGTSQLYSLLLDNCSFEVLEDGDDHGRGPKGIMVAGRRYEVRVQDERSRRLALVDRNLRPPDGELQIKAPIPGLVVKVSVLAGQAVGEGEPLVILEAMKMENELRSPKAGTVLEVRVEAGQQVALNQVLVTLH